MLSDCIFLITKIHIPASTYKIISGIHALTLSPPRLKDFLELMFNSCYY
nr:MAG TPA: hypothetical protein [Caudoviricetes sp.]